jgi:hypothetical protein
MSGSEQEAAGDPVPIADVRSRIREVKRSRLDKQEPGHSGHGDGVETVREDDYKGHHIVVRTTYRVEVDGRRVTGHISVGNDGRVHSHAIPNVSFESALDVVRQLIDAFPDEFEAGETQSDDHNMHH